MVASAVVAAEAEEMATVICDGGVFDLGRGAGVGAAGAAAVEQVGDFGLGPFHVAHRGLGWEHKIPEANNTGPFIFWT